MKKQTLPALLVGAAALLLIGIAVGQLIARHREAEAPDTAPPLTGPITTDADTTDADTTDTDTTDTDTTDTDTTDADTTESDTTDADTTESDTTDADTTDADTTDADTTDTDTSESDTTEADTTDADTTDADTTQSDTTEADTTAADTTDADTTDAVTDPPHSHAPDGKIRWDDNTHWYVCTCGLSLREGGHYDTNKNGKCDVCGCPVAVETEPDVSGPALEGEKLEELLEPAKIILLRPEASGIRVHETADARLDYSHSEDGYVMVRTPASGTERMKVKIQGPATEYTYNLKPGEWTVFPLSDGSGSYRLTVFRNVSGNRYAAVLAHAFEASLRDEFAPFLRPNQYVNYENAHNTMNKAASLTAGISDTLKKVEAIYNFVTGTITYDYAKAATVASGYLPDLDRVLAEKKGICFDYAALMAGMLRSQGIACKLVVGYADSQYHAWISVWTPDQGWIDGAIFFDGVKWQRMDPTFASSGQGTGMDGVVYTSKYIY